MTINDEHWDGDGPQNDSWLLPDPFLKDDGTRISSRSEWAEQRIRLTDVLQYTLYGTMPPAPQQVLAESKECRRLWKGEGMFELISLTVPNTPAGIDVNFTVRVCRPTQVAYSVPIIVPNYASPNQFAGFFVSEATLYTAISRGYSIIGFEVDKAAPDDVERFFDSPCVRAYPGYTWHALAVWAWLQSRVIDWLETCDWADSDKVVATGHSRFGKVALCCGIFDTRVAVTAPAGSGCGGMGSLRLQGNRFGQGYGHFERIGRMAKCFPHWILPDAGAYGSFDGVLPYRENELPFDSNIMASCIAPRGLIVSEGLDDGASNQFGTLSAWLAASEVYRFLGAAEYCGIHYREGGHTYALEDWNVLMDFCDTVLLGKNIETTYRTRVADDSPVGYRWNSPVTD